MLMPAFLPEQLNYCQKAETQVALFELLKKYPPDLIMFLEYACSDETWSENHFDFVHLGIEWVNSQFFQDNLMVEFAQRLSNVLRQHSVLAESHLPLNVILQLKDREIAINTLLYGSSSRYWKELIRSECRDRNTNTLTLKEIPFEVFTLINEFITKENMESVHVTSKEIVEAILALSLTWDLELLGEECQKSLKKWISRDNMVETLIKSHKNRWLTLRSNSMEYMNALELDFRLYDSQADHLVFEFIRFSEISLSFFQQLKTYITIMNFSGKTPEDPTFSKVINDCPNLVGLDLSYSQTFTDYLKDIPPQLEELILSSCNWLNNETFTLLMGYCPQLVKLCTASDVNLNFEVWNVLGKLSKLKVLDLSRCNQIKDDDIKLILQSCEGLLSLSLEECHGISDEGFNFIPIYNNNLMSINFARSKLSDPALIDIANKCVHLQTLDLSRCENVTEKGLFEVVRAAKALRELKVKSFKISEGMLTKLKNLNPLLKIVI